MPDALEDGARVQVVASDPWDFVDDEGSNSFQGQVVGAAQQDGVHRFLLLLLDKPVVSQGSHCRTFVAVTSGESGGDAGLDCHLYGTDLADAEDIPLAQIVERWRGGLAARGTLRADVDGAA
ncbi:MAG: hypothetical protein GEU74_08465 [Nitriliruptorales bacterium]|nr:hypothetical protein [Nitriliruptorales bacterium]